jgi:hypothetical protein
VSPVCADRTGESVAQSASQNGRLRQTPRPSTYCHSSCSPAPCVSHCSTWCCQRTGRRTQTGQQLRRVGIAISLSHLFVPRRVGIAHRRSDQMAGHARPTALPRHPELEAKDLCPAERSYASARSFVQETLPFAIRTRLITRELAQAIQLLQINAQP